MGPEPVVTIRWAAGLEAGRSRRRGEDPDRGKPGHILALVVMEGAEATTRRRGAGGRYRLLGVLPRLHGMVVWDAEDTGLHRRVSVVMVPESVTADERVVERLRRTVRVSRLWLAHPNIVRVLYYDQESDPANHFVVMEAVEGETLSRRLAREGALPPEEVCRIGAGIADALEAAHGAGIVHGALAPDEVVLTPQGDVKLMNFGLEWEMRSGAANSVDNLLPQRMVAALEERRVADGRGLDLRRLGEMLLSALAGGRPDVRPAPPVSGPGGDGMGRDLHAEIEHLCRRAIDQDPADPLWSAADMASALRSMIAPRGPQLSEESLAVGRLAIPPPPPVGSIDRPRRQASRGAAEARPTEAPPGEEGMGGPPELAPPIPAIGRGGGIRRDTGRRSRLGPVKAAAVGAVVVLAVGLIVARTVLEEGSAPARSPALPGASQPPEHAPTFGPGQPGSTEVPAVAGLHMYRARARLYEAGLRLGSVLPVLGPAGRVVRSVPPSGADVRPGQRVSLFVGVTARRLEELSRTG
jgi:eukaryotic-like serine/threonine-protein kinase